MTPDGACKSRLQPLDTPDQPPGGTRAVVGFWPTGHQEVDRKVELMAGVNPLKFLQEVRQETSKVTWPTRQETLVSTIMVLVMMLVASLFFLAADQLISWAVKLVLSIR